MSIHRIVLIVNLMLLTGSAYSAVGLTYRIIEASIGQSAVQQPAQAEKTAVSQKKRPKRLTISHYRPIVERNLFKTKKGNAKPVLPDPEELEETKLDLKLWGTVSGLKKRTYAVIADNKNRKQNLYREGESIQNAKIKSILREKVILSVNGKDEILAMEKLDNGKGQSGNDRSSQSQSSRYRSGRDSGRRDRPLTRTQRVSLRRSMIDNAMQDVSSLMTQITIKPHSENGQTAGLALENIKPNSIFRRMGLRNGDILKGIDGQQIESVDDALKLYQSLKEASNANVQIERRGQERTINYNIR
ncbi:MAG: PDZ domain-containing protein [Desulfobacteraceae bacterium]|nr:PDZ domain-containing protein [Desulfobacteraceae bacterium]